MELAENFKNFGEYAEYINKQLQEDVNKFDNYNEKIQHQLYKVHKKSISPRSPSYIGQSRQEKQIREFQMQQRRRSELAEHSLADRKRSDLSNSNSKILGRVNEHSKEYNKMKAYSYDEEDNERSHDTANWQNVHKNPQKVDLRVVIDDKTQIPSKKLTITHKIRQNAAPKVEREKPKAVMAPENDLKQQVRKILFGLFC